jgi:hypothetical protein
MARHPLDHIETKDRYAARTTCVWRAANIAMPRQRSCCSHVPQTGRPDCGMGWRHARLNRFSP